MSEMNKLDKELNAQEEASDIKNKVLDELSNKNDKGIEKATDNKRHKGELSQDSVHLSFEATQDKNKSLKALDEMKNSLSQKISHEQEDINNLLNDVMDSSSSYKEILKYTVKAKQKKDDLNKEINSQIEFENDLLDIEDSNQELHAELEASEVTEKESMEMTFTKTGEIDTKKETVNTAKSDLGSVKQKIAQVKEQRKKGI